MVSSSASDISGFWLSLVVFLLVLPSCDALGCFNSTVTVQSPEGLCGSRTFGASSCAESQAAADDMAKQMYKVMLQTFLPIGYDFPTKYWPCESFYDWAFCHGQVKAKPSCAGLCNMLWGVMESAMTRCSSPSQCLQPSINVSGLSSFKKPCCSSLRGLVSASCTLAGSDVDSVVGSLKTDIYPKCSDTDCFSFSSSKGGKTAVDLTSVLVLSLWCMAVTMFLL